MEDDASDQYFVDNEDKDFDNDEYNANIDSEDSVDSNQLQIDEKQEETDKPENADEDGIGRVFSGHRFNKKLTCVRYPGKVLNPEKAIETLGGLVSISTAIDLPKRRLELRFRPNDGYSKAACGDKHTVSGFLLRIRVKKSRAATVKEKQRENVPEPSTVDKDTAANDQELDKNIPPTFNRHQYENLSNATDYEVPKLKVLGRVTTEFRFQGLCDFQYLPITKNLIDKKNEYIYEEIYPTGIPPLRWLDNEVPYFLPPAVFSRMDTVQHISMKPELKNTGPDHVMGITRKSRSVNCNYFDFNKPVVPTAPPQGVQDAMKIKLLNETHLQPLRELFADRPIWSKSALLHKSNVTAEHLRILLPAVAYYCIEGPWRIMWVRLGFDPREDTTTRIYQTLDYRLKSMHGLEQNIKGKRYCTYSLPHKSPWTTKQPTTAILTNMADVKDTKKNKKYSDDGYIYRDGIIPPSKQMFYQYCDVQCDEIQEMLAKLPEILPGTKCHKQRGWLPSGFGDQCREIINRQVKAVLRKRMNIPENYPTILPKERRPVPQKTKKNQAAVQLSKKLFSNPKQREGKSCAEESDPDWDDV